MKVITCAPLPPPHGGIANWYAVLCAEAQRRNFTFLNIDTSPKKSVDGRSLFYRIFVQGFRMLGQFREMKRLIKQHPDVDAAHITTSGQLALVRDIALMKLLKKNNIRSVYHLHFGAVPDMFESKNLDYKILCKAMSLASEVIAIDPKTYEIISGVLGDEHVHYIPNPVDAVDVEANDDSRRILFLGNVLSSKGVDELLEAWGSIAGDYPDWKLTIAGFCEDKYKTYLERRYSMKQVEWLGFVEHEKAMELLSNSDFLVLPSYIEGFPNVVLEAMMRQKAVVATDVGAVSDALSGDCGIIIRPKSVEDIKNAMEQLINDPQCRKQMGENGRRRATELYETSSVMDRYVQLWRKN